MAAAEAQRDSTRAGTSSEEQLLDVLYEIMAQGVDPSRELSLAQVEAFLHAHARQRKSVAELRAFFEQNSLTEDPAAYASDPDLGVLASGLKRARSPNSSVFMLDTATAPDPIADSPTKSNRAPTAAAPLADETSGLKARTPEQPSAAHASPWLYAGIAACALLLAGLGLTFARASELEHKLSQARLQQRTTDVALTALEQRAEGLRSELGQSEQARRALSERFESYVVSDTNARAAESDVLKRLLGPRYDALRTRVLETAAQTAPVAR